MKLKFRLILFFTGSSLAVSVILGEKGRQVDHVGTEQRLSKQSLTDKREIKRIIYYLFYEQ